jgi:signal transduction protein with GAF and PtsI domain
MATKKKKSTTKSKAAKKTAKADEGRTGTEASSSLEDHLRSAVRAVEVADLLTIPLTHSIENLLQLAAQSLNADAASVLVRDGSEGGLKFLVAIGPVADKLMGIRIPPGRGVVGFVFASGQPMAVDVSQDPNFYPAVDSATGYRTLITLATPLRVASEAVGVLQFVNRPDWQLQPEGTPAEAFTPEEMEKAAIFADAIAALVDAHETAGMVETLFELSIKSAADAQGGEEAGDRIRKWLSEVQTAPEHKDLMALAISLRDIASRGDAERELCRDILDTLARYTERGGLSTTYLGF